MPPAITTLDFDQPVQNYFAARRMKQQENAQQQQNALAARKQQMEETRFAREGEDYTRRINRENMQDISAARQEVSAFTSNLLMSLPPDDPDFDQKKMQITESVGNYAHTLGIPAEEIVAGAQQFVTGYTPEAAKNLWIKSGKMKAPAELTGEAKNLEIIQGRLPTLAEYQQLKGKKDQTLPADAQMTEYLVDNGIAANKSDAYKMVKLSKNDPVELVAKLVKDAEKIQTDNMIGPGDPAYRDRKALVEDAKALVKSIRSDMMSADQGEAAKADRTTPPPAKQPAAPQGPQTFINPQSGQQVTLTGQEPTITTMEQFSQLPSGSIFIDGNTGQPKIKP